MRPDHDRLMWLCACCALIETQWLDADEQPVCSLCRELSCEAPCKVRSLLNSGKLEDVVAEILRPRA